MTKQPPAVPLPGPNATPEPNEKIKGLAGNCSRHTNQATRHPSNQKKSRFWQEFHCWGTELHCSRHRNLCTEHQRHFQQGRWQAIPLDTLQIRKTPWHGVTKQPPAVPLPGPNVTPEPNEKSRVWQAIFPGTQNKPQDTLQIRKTPWHGVTKQPKQPSNQENTLASRRNSLLPSLCPGQTSLLNRMKKSRFWQAIHCSKAQKASQKTPFESGKHPGTPPAVPLPGPNVTPEPNEKIKVLAGNSTVSGAETKPQDTLQIRKTPWHGVTEQPPALNRMKKSRVWQAIVPGTQNKPQDTLQIRKTPWHGVTKQPPAVLCPGQTSLLNRMKKSRVWQAIVPGTQNKPQDTLQIRKTPWHGVTKQPPAIPLPGPNVTPEPNEKIKGLAGNCSRHTKQATRHPSNQENTWHGGRNSLLPSLCLGQTSLLNRMKKARVAIVPGTQNKPQDTLQIRKTPGMA